MNNGSDLLTHPFTLGLGTGLIFAAIVFVRYLLLGSELRRMKRHLHDRMEIEADAVRAIKKERDGLREENGNLRVQIATLNQAPDRRSERNLEIFARAEKRMLISVPGFAPAWEKAKADANQEVADEEAGKSLPKRVFNRLFGAPGRPDEKALPDSTTV